MTLEEDNSTNRLEESLRLFTDVRSFVYACADLLGCRFSLVRREHVHSLFE